MEDSTDIFGFSGGVGVEQPKPPSLGTPLVEHTFSQKNPIHTITQISLTNSNVITLHRTAYTQHSGKENTTWETKA